MTNISRNFVPVSQAFSISPSEEPKRSSNDDHVAEKEQLSSSALHQDIEDSLLVKQGVSPDRSLTGEPSSNREERLDRYNQLLERGEAIIDSLTDPIDQFQEALASSSSLESEEVGGLVSSSFSTLKVIALNEKLTLLKQALAAKEQQAEEIRNSPSFSALSDEYQMLLGDIALIKGDMALIKKEIAFESLGVAQAAAQIESSVSSIVQVIQDNTSGGASTLTEQAAEFGGIGVGSISLVTGAVDLTVRGNEYRQLNQTLVELQEKADALKASGQEGSPEFIACSEQIAETQKKMDRLADELVDRSLTTARSLVNTLGAAVELVHHVASGLSDAGMGTLSTMSLSAPIVAGILNSALSTKRIVNNVIIASKIDQEIAEITTQLSQTTPPIDPIVRDILIMKLKNLEFQKENNAVSAFRNGINVFSGAFGTTAGVAALVGATATATVIATTAGIGAAALAGVAISVGAGYYIYKHHLSMETRMQSAFSMTREWMIKQEIGRNASILEEIEKQKQHLATASKEKTGIEISFSEKLAALLDELKEKEQALDTLDKLKFDIETVSDAHLPSLLAVEEEMAKLQREITECRALIDVLTKEAVGAASIKAKTMSKLNHSSIDERKSFEAIGRVKREIEAQEKAKKDIEKLISDFEIHSVDHPGEAKDIDVAITQLNQDVAKLNQQLVDLNSQLRKLSEEAENGSKELKELERINKTNEVVIALLDAKREEAKKLAALEEDLENRSISACVKGSTPEEIARFKEALASALQSTAQEAEIRQFLDSKGIKSPLDDLSKGCLQFLVLAAA